MSVGTGKPDVPPGRQWLESRADPPQSMWAELLQLIGKLLGRGEPAHPALTLHLPEWDLTISNPTETDIKTAVQELVWDAEKDGCLDLNRSADNSWLQVIAQETGGYALWTWKLETRYQTISPLSQDLATQIALLYAANDESWWQATRWQVG